MLLTTLHLFIFRREELWFPLPYHVDPFGQNVHKTHVNSLTIAVASGTPLPVARRAPLRAALPREETVGRIRRKPTACGEFRW